MLGPLQNFFALYSQAEESLATFDKQYSETFFHLLDPCRKCRLCDTARSRGTREVPFACQCSQKFEMPKDHVDIYISRFKSYSFIASRTGMIPSRSRQIPHSAISDRN